MRKGSCEPQELKVSNLELEGVSGCRCSTPVRSIYRTFCAAPTAENSVATLKATRMRRIISPGSAQVGTTVDYLPVFDYCKIASALITVASIPHVSQVRKVAPHSSPLPPCLDASPLRKLTSQSQGVFCLSARKRWPTARSSL